MNLHNFFIDIVNDIRTCLTGTANEAGFDLAIVNSGIKIGIPDGNWMDTGIKLPSYESFLDWGMLVINCDRNSGNVWIYYVTSGKIYASNVMTVDDLSMLVSGSDSVGGSVWFSSSGTINLGGGLISGKFISFK